MHGLYQGKRKKAYLTFPQAVEITAFYSFPGKRNFTDTSQNKFIKTANCRQISSSHGKQLGLPESQMTSILMDHFFASNITQHVRELVLDFFRSVREIKTLQKYIKLIIFKKYTLYSRPISHIIDWDEIGLKLIFKFLLQLLV